MSVAVEGCKFQMRKKIAHHVLFWLNEYAISAVSTLVSKNTGGHEHGC